MFRPAELILIAFVSFSPVATLRTTSRSIRDPCPSFLSREWLTRPEKGQLLFSQHSELGASLVNVTAHPVLGREAAHLVLVDHDEKAASSWNVLRFDTGGEGSFQSVSRIVTVPGLQRQAQPLCLPFEYTRSIVSLVAALIGLQSQVKAALVPPVSTVPHKWSCLFIGLGGGSMPLFLSHAFPGLAMDIAEIDATVIKAASEIMGFPLDRPGMQVHHKDAAVFMTEAKANNSQYDFIIFDAVNGSNELPPALLTPGFLGDLAAVLHPAHGSLIMNIHADVETLPRGLLRQQLPSARPFDPQTAAGQQISRISDVFRSALLQGAGSRTGEGSAFIVRAMHQANVAMTISRGVHMSGQPSRVATVLRSAAEDVGRRSNFPFPAGVRAQNRLMLLAGSSKPAASSE